MALFNGNSNMPQMAIQAMGNASNTMASQQKQTKTITRREGGDFWDDLYKGAAALNQVGKGISGLVGAAEGVWDMYDKYKLHSSYDDVSKAYGEGGMQALDGNPEFQDYWHQMAVGKFMQDRASTEKGRVEMQKNMDAQADRLYQDWRAQAMGVKEAFQSGDMNRFMPQMAQLSASSPLPYKLVPDQQTGNFRVMFRSDKDMGWVDTGRMMTPAESFQEVSNVLRGEQMVMRGVDMKLAPVNSQFYQAARRHYMTTMQVNAENRLDPRKQVPLYDNAGNIRGVGIIQNSVLDYGVAPVMEVFGRSGKRIGTFNDYQTIAQHTGWSPLQPQKQGKGRGAGDVTTLGPKSPLHAQLVSRGLIYDKDQKWYYPPKEDADGKMVPDHSRPLSMEALQSLAGTVGAGGGYSADPFGLRGGGNAGEAGPKKQKPNIPQKEKKPAQNSSSAAMEEKKSDKADVQASVQ